MACRGSRARVGRRKIGDGCLRLHRAVVVRSGGCRYGHLGWRSDGQVKEEMQLPQRWYPDWGSRDLASWREEVEQYTQSYCGLETLEIRLGISNRCRGC